MKWLIDNQLPHALCTALKKRGHIAIHASELPQGSLHEFLDRMAMALKDGGLVELDRSTLTIR